MPNDCARNMNKNLECGEKMQSKIQMRVPNALRNTHVVQNTRTALFIDAGPLQHLGYENPSKNWLQCSPNTA